MAEFSSLRRRMIEAHPGSAPLLRHRHRSQKTLCGARMGYALVPTHIADGGFNDAFDAPPRQLIMRR
jgi:hypothetical protein